MLGPIRASAFSLSSASRRTKARLKKTFENVKTVVRAARRNPRDFASRLWCPRTIAKSLVILSVLVLIASIVFEVLLYTRTGKTTRLGSMALTPFILMTRPNVTLAQGTFQGRTSKVGPVFIESFLGIPYGQTTGGNNRFRAPVPVEASEGIYDARSWGHKCYGGGDTHDERSGEDCLNLNIWRPRGVNPEQKMPVVVYIHGGAFNFGSGKERDIASFVAWGVEPFIGVSINYRLGALGFLPSNLTAEEGILNLGLKDQAMAFQWVQDNIGVFGGDKDKVTIWGSSAGAHSVGHHLMRTDVPAAFQGVIMESGGPTARACYPYDHPLHETQFKEFLTLTGTIDLPDESKMTHLRALDIETIVAASETVYARYDKSLRWPFQPVIDGPDGMIPMAPIESWKTRAYHKVPIVTGFNTNEGNIFIQQDVEEPEQFTDFFKTLIPKLSQEELDELDQKIYPDPSKDPESIYLEDRPGFGKQYKRLARAYGDYAYVAPVRHTAHFASAFDKPDDREVWIYQFDVNTTVAGGASHGEQRDYVTYSRSVTSLRWSVQEAVAQQMHAYWTSFVLSGNVNDIKKGRAKNRSTWAQYGKRGSSAKMVFGEKNDQRAGGSEKGYLTENRPDLWGDKEGDWWWARAELTESN